MPRSSTFQLADTQQTCPMCGGTGQVPDPRDPRNANGATDGRQMPCPMCAGNGRVSSSTADLREVSQYRKLEARARQDATKARLRDQEKAKEKNEQKVASKRKKTQTAAERSARRRDSN